MKGRTPWNKGLKGAQIAWNKGKQFSEESKQKMSLAHKGKKLSEEHKKNLSIAFSGEKHPLFGKKHKPETIEKIKNARLGKFYGENNANWKGGKMTRENGYIYIYIPEHPYSDPFGYYPEHRLVMEKKLCRYLLPKEIVHHINGNKHDNREENLELIKNSSEHQIYHNKLRKQLSIDK